MEHLKLFALVITYLFTTLCCAQQVNYFPPKIGDAWETTSTSDLGWCTDSINSLYDFLDSLDTKSFIVLKDGKIVLEKYFGTYKKDSTYFWFSAGKSFMATIAGKALEEGLLDLNDKTSDHLGLGWSGVQKEKEDLITVWHQLTMTAGLDETKFACTTPSCLNYIADAGTRWAYHNGPYALMKDVLENATGSTLNAYTNSKIKTPIGMKGFWISFLGGNYYISKARDMARFGLLIANNGIWNTDTVLKDTSYLRQMITPSQNLNKSYGYLWWLNGQDSYITTGAPTLINQTIAPNAPMDVYTAAGLRGQFISISPSNGLVVVRQGLSPTSDYTEFEMHDQIWKHIMNLNCNATSIQTANKELNVSVSPNPTKDILTINGLNSEDKVIVKVFSIDGVLVAETQSINLSLQGLEAGVYLINITQDELNRTFKVLKN